MALFVAVDDINMFSSLLQIEGDNPVLKKIFSNATLGLVEPLVPRHE